MSTAYLRCMEESCREQYPLDHKEHTCERCGNLLDVHYEFQMRHASDARSDDAAEGESLYPRALRQIWERRKGSSAVIDQSGVWRFRELLPFVPAGASVVTLSEGRTPLVEVARTGDWVGGVHLAVKHQGNNPTGSFKDLGMTACITQAAAVGSRVTACAST
jgi:threonine synthase